jgi:hypothetical protein
MRRFCSDFRVAREMSAEIAWSCQGGATQQTAREHAICGHADTQFGEYGEDAHLGRWLISEYQSVDRRWMNGCGGGWSAGQLRRPMARTYPALQIGDRADRVLDGNGSAAARGAVDNDVIAEALQTVGEKVLDRRGAGVVTGPACPPRKAPNSGNQRRGGQGARPGFVVPYAVEIAQVKQGNAALEAA